MIETMKQLPQESLEEVVRRIQNATNQSAKADEGKAPISLVPTKIWYDIAYVRRYGNMKYPKGGKDNWKQVEYERYIDALFRHLLAVKDDPKSCDAESGLPHLWHCACNVAFLCELIDAEPRNGRGNADANNNADNAVSHPNDCH